MASFLGQPPPQQEQQPIPVNSSWVASIFYDGANLTVRTKGGDTYTYLSVPLYLWEQLQASPSKGKFINDKIKGRFVTL